MCVCAQEFDAFNSGYQSDSQVDLPLDGDDYEDELEALLYADGHNGGNSNNNGNRGRRGRSSRRYK